MSETQLSSTMRRPAAKLISRFGVWQVKDHTIRTYLENGWSLGICCRSCPRTIEWTPPELQRRFENQLDLQLKRLVPRLSCTGEEGCGSQDVAVFPHLYDHPWSWSPQG